MFNLEENCFQRCIDQSAFMNGETQQLVEMGSDW